MKLKGMYMEKKEKIYHKLWFKVIVVIAVVLIGFSVRTYLEKVYKDSQRQEGTVQFFDDGTRVGRELDYAPNVDDDNKILQAFKAVYPNATVLAACKEDLTDDGLDDLVVIYNTNSKETDEYSETTTLVNGGYIRMVVGLDSGDGENYVFSAPVPSPIENQKIKFQNIDKEAEMEFILQGQKGSKVGYGIYRVIDGALVNLFAEGLEEC